MQKKIMIIGAGEMQTPVILRAKDLGLFVITIDGNIKAEGNKYADLALEIDTNDKIKIFEAAKKYQIDGILTTSDYPVRVVAYVCEKLELSGLKIYAAELCTNKFLFREHLKNHSFENPKYHLIDNDNFDFNIIDYFPVVVKPIDSSASRGVKKANNLSELNCAYSEAKVFSKTGEVLIEEFLLGPEFSVEALTYKGETEIIAITEKRTNGLDESYFVEDRHLIPANLTKNQHSQMSVLVREVIKAIGLDNCATHTEIKLTDEGLAIIEVGARLGGDFIASDLVFLSSGIDMLANVINIAIGNNIQIKRLKNNFAGIQFVNSENYALAKQHIDRINNKDGFIKSELKAYKKIELKNSLNRLGYFICTDDTRKGLENLLNYEN